LLVDKHNIKLPRAAIIGYDKLQSVIFVYKVSYITVKSKFNSGIEFAIHIFQL